MFSIRRYNRKKQEDRQLKRRIIFIAFVIVECLWGAVFVSAAETDSSHRISFEEGQAVVVFQGKRNKNFGRKVAQSLIDDGDIQVSDTCCFVYNSRQNNSAILKSSQALFGEKVLAVALVKSQKLSTEEIIDCLQEEETIHVVVPNFRTKTNALTNDTYLKSQWALQNTGQNGGSYGLDLNPEMLWKKTASGGDKVVAVLDTGVDYHHEDLKGNIWVNPYQKKLPGKYGYDFYNNDGNPLDDNGHGTHCSGIIGAVGDNGKGICGIGKNVKIMALKHMGANGSGNFYDAIKCYEYVSRAQDLGVDVVAVSNSYGIEDTGSLSSKQAEEIKSVNALFAEMMDIVGEKGAVSVVAAGNTKANLDVSQGCPSGAKSLYKLTVAATNDLGNLAEYSNYGRRFVDLAAPGSNILSTTNENSFLPGIYTKEKRQVLNAYYSDYEEEKIDDISWGIPELYDKDSYENGFMKVSLDHTKWFQQGHQSLKLSFSGVKAHKQILLEIPYTIKNVSKGVKISMAMLGSTSVREKQGTVKVLDRASDVVTADVIKEIENGEEFAEIDACGEWRYCSVDAQAVVSSDIQNRKVILCVEFPEDGDYSLYLDQIGVSKGNITEEAFGKYSFMDGTSMACPYVAGAAALIASADPDLSAQGIISSIKRSIRPLDSLKGKTTYGGMLDLSKVKLSGKVTSVKLNKKTLKLSKGKSEKLKAAISPKGKKISWKSSNPKIVSVDRNGKVTANGYGKAVITAFSGEKKATCKVTSGYKIQYKLNGGINSKKNLKAYYKETMTLKKPMKRGYLFKGWYTDKAYKKRLKKITKQSKRNYTLYAKWEKIDRMDKAYIYWISKRQSSTIWITCKEEEEADGYQIKYSLRKDFKKTHTKTINSRFEKKKIQGLKKQKTYYVKIRTWKIDSAGKKVYGKYSRIVEIQ